MSNTKNTIDTIRNQIKALGFTASTQQIKDQAFLLNINLETATTQEKKMITEAIVNNVKNDNNALTIPGKTVNAINLQDSEKQDLIRKHSEKLQISLTSTEVTEISKNISDSFKNRQSIARQIISAIKKYVEYQADLEALAIAETAKDIIDIQNRTDAKAVSKLQEISTALKDNETEWQKAADDVLDLFKV